MRRLLNIISAITLLVCMVGCSDQNDNFDQYLRNGERVYIGKVDSTKVFAGINRFKAVVYSSDVRIEKMKIFWGLRSDSIQYAIPAHRKNEPLEFIVERGSKTLPERDYVLEFVNYDDKGNRSMSVEAITNVYGDFFMSQIYDLNTVVKFSYNALTGNRLTVAFSPRISSSETGVYVLYLNQDQKWVRNYYLREDIDKLTNRTLTLNKVDLPTDKAKIRFYMQSVFVPEKNCIDTAYMPARKITSNIARVDLEDANALEAVLSAECKKLYPND